MPQGAKYRIWGWDVGDYTGDGYNDLADLDLHPWIAQERMCCPPACGHRWLHDEHWFVHRVGFVDFPLEVGVVVKENTCYIVQKKRSEYWQMKGYRYVDGSVVLVDEFVSNKCTTTRA